MGARRGDHVTAARLGMRLLASLSLIIGSVAWTPAVLAADGDVTAGGGAIVYGDPIPEITCDSGGYFDPTTGSVYAPDDFGFTTPLTGILPAGSYVTYCPDITGGGGATPNVSSGELTVATYPIVVKAADDSKTYDGTSIPSGPGVVPALYGTTMTAGDTIDCTQAFVGKTTAVTATGVTGCDILDGSLADVSANYDLTTLTGVGEIDALHIDVYAADDSKDYDGTTAPSPGVLPAAAPPGLAGGDTLVCTQVFDIATTAATTTTVVPGSCSVTDGSAADVTDQYDISTFTGTGTIDPRPVTVAAGTDAKTYDGTTDPSGSAGAPVVGPGTLVAGDTLVCTQRFDVETTAATKTRIVSCSITDGTAADVTDQYALSFTDGSGAIGARPIVVRAANDTKPYDGTTDPSAPGVVPALYDGTLVGGDTLVCTQAFDTDTTAATATEVVDCSITDGTAADVTDQYAIAVSDGTGTITQRPITVTTVTDSKPFDGTTSSVGVPTQTGGLTLVTGDTLVCDQTFDTDDAGTGKTMVGHCSITDGTAADVTANYLITYVEATTGVITAATTTVLYTGPIYQPGVGAAGVSATATTIAPCWTPGSTVVFKILAVGSPLGTVPTSVPASVSGTGTVRTASAVTSSLPVGIYSIDTVFTPGEPGNCLPSTDSAVLAVVGAGDTANGGGSYRVGTGGDYSTGSPRVNFGFTIQRTTKAIKGTTNTLVTYKGQLLWVNQGAWRFKGSVSSQTVVNGSTYVSGDQFGYGTFPCPPLVLDATTFTPAVCGSMNGVGTLQVWATDHWADYATGIHFTANAYDGGVSQICKTQGKKQSCTYTDRADWFGVQFVELGSRSIRESGPISLRSGSIKVGVVANPPY